MSTPSRPDWDAAETLLIEAGNRAIESFIARHATETCSFFAFSVDYCFGDVVICLDTNDNSLLHAQRHEHQTLKAWESTLGSENGWENAQYFLTRSRLTCCNMQTANFKYPDVASLHFSDWEDFFLNDQISETPNPSGHIVVLMYKVISKMVAARSFDRLVLNSPFRVGIEFPRDELELVVMKFLNWPAHQGPRV